MSARAWFLFAAVSLIWGVPYLFIKIAIEGGMPAVSLAWARTVLGAMGASLTIAALLLTVPAAFGYSGERPSDGAIASVVVLGLLCTAAALVLMTMLVDEVGPGRALVVTYVNPVVAVALGVTFLGESPGPGAIAGLALILAGSWLATGGALPVSSSARTD